MSETVVWHDVECGSYAADLPLWRELAGRAGGPVLELGAGTGRVALELAGRGHDVTALDSDPDLLEELARRAGARELNVRCVEGDARSLPRLDCFALVIAPMQLMQIVGGPQARGDLLGGVAGLLSPAGWFAAALTEGSTAIAPHDATPPLPDVGERAGWIYSSLPVDVRAERNGVAVERLRQLVSPSGTLTEQRHTQLLDGLTRAQLEREATPAGLRPRARHEIPPTGDHVGSVVVVLERADADPADHNAGHDFPRGHS